MPLRTPHLAMVALGLSLAGCGGDPKEEAPGVATAAGVPRAPPNAVGHNVFSTASPPIPTKMKTPDPTPIYPGGKPKPTSDLEVPTAPPAPSQPPKGTQL